MKDNKKIIIIIFVIITGVIITAWLILNNSIVKNETIGGICIHNENPDDINRNEKSETIANSTFHTLLPKQTYYPLDWETFNVNSSCKRIEIYWNVLNNSQNRELTTEEENDLYIYIKLSNFTISQTYYDFKISPERNKISIKTTNKEIQEKWTIYFYNQLENIDVDISFKIVKITEA